MSIDPDLVRVIAQTESGGNKWAMRFEPATYAAILNGNHAAACASARKANNCSYGTGRMICATSWGTYQMMGFNLYGPVGSSVGAYMSDNVAQDQMLEHFLTADGLQKTMWKDLVAGGEVREHFIGLYNGPGDTDAYWTLMQNAARAIGLASDG